MPVTLSAIGESTESGDLAFMNAIGSIASAMNEAASSVIISREVVQTSNGYQVTIRVVLYDEEEIADTLKPNLPDPEKLTKAKGSVPKDRSTDFVALYAAQEHARLLGAVQGEMEHVAVETMLHPAPLLEEDPLPHDFDAATQDHDERRREKEAETRNSQPAGATLEVE